MITTGIKKTGDKYKVWFKIGNQTFYLDDTWSVHEDGGLESAKWLENQLKISFGKLNK